MNSIRGRSSSSSTSGKCSGGFVLGLLVTTNLLVFQLSGMYYSVSRSGGSTGSVGGFGGSGFELPGMSHQQKRHPILDLPLSPAVALPSERVEGSSVDSVRKYYGGKGDKPHLGGFATGSIDMMGVSPAAWKWMVHHHGIQSLLDVGCGRGISTSWFYTHGVDARCVEGSHDAVQQSVLPRELVTEHDFSRGPWWPPKTVDAVWCVELLEHVGRNFHKNLLPAFRKAALVYATHSNWGGWHHVEVHPTEWWIARFQSFGFVYSQWLTDQIRNAAVEHMEDPAPDGTKYNAQHIWTTMMVFINPTVASLPQHNHLMADYGCYTEGDKRHKCGDITQVESHMHDNVKLETPLPPDYDPLPLTDEMDARWEMLVFGKTNITTTQVSPAAA